MLELVQLGPGGLPKVLWLQFTGLLPLPELARLMRSSKFFRQAEFQAQFQSRWNGPEGQFMRLFPLEYSRMTERGVEYDWAYQLAQGEQKANRRAHLLKQALQNFKTNPEVARERLRGLADFPERERGNPTDDVILWAGLLGYQNVLDAFYPMIKKARARQFDIPEWAICTRQPLSEIPDTNDSATFQHRMFLACKYGHEAFIDKVLRFNGAHVFFEWKNEEGFSGIEVAHHCTQHRIVRQISKAVNFHLFTQLCRSPKIKFLNILFKNGFTLDEDLALQLFDMLCQEKHFRIAAWLLERNENFVNAEILGRLLWRACARDDVEAAKFLVEHNANLNMLLNENMGMFLSDREAATKRTPFNKALVERKYNTAAVLVNSGKKIVDACEGRNAEFLIPQQNYDEFQVVLEASRRASVGGVFGVLPLMVWIVLITRYLSLPELARLSTACASFFEEFYRRWNSSEGVFLREYPEIYAQRISSGYLNVDWEEALVSARHSENLVLPDEWATMSISAIDMIRMKKTHLLKEHFRIYVIVLQRTGNIEFFTELLQSPNGNLFKRVALMGFQKALDEMFNYLILPMRRVQGISVFLWAIRLHQPLALIEREVEEWDAEQLSPLGVACTYGHFDAACFYLKRNGIEESTRELLVAYKQGHGKIVRFFVDQMAQFAEAILSRACRMSDAELVFCLFDNQIRIDEIALVRVLSVALAEEQIEIAKRIIQAGVVLTPEHLMCVCSWKNQSAQTQFVFIKYLVNKNVDPSCLFQEPYSPLFHALMNNETIALNERRSLMFLIRRRLVDPNNSVVRVGLFRRVGVLCGNRDSVIVDLSESLLEAGRLRKNLIQQLNGYLDRREGNLMAHYFLREALTEPSEANIGKIEEFKNFYTTVSQEPLRILYKSCLEMLGMYENIIMGLRK